MRTHSLFHNHIHDSGVRAVHVGTPTQSNAFGSSSSATGCPTTLSVSRILAGLVQRYNFTLEHVALPTSAEDLQSAVDGVCRFNVKFREWCCLLRDSEAGGCCLGNSEDSHNADRRSYLWPWVLNYSAAAQRGGDDEISSKNKNSRQRDKDEAGQSLRPLLCSSVSTRQEHRGNGLSTLPVGCRGGRVRLPGLGGRRPPKGEASSLGEPPRKWQCAKTEK